MKKKGLLISTIVMVVVLIAALTTSTYAWFTAAGSAEVSTIEFSVAAASDLLIGVHKNNTLSSGATWDDFYADSTVYTATVGEENRGTWTGDTKGLGLSINTGLNLGSLQKAVYSFNDVKLKDGSSDLSNFNLTNNGITAATQDTYTRGTDATNVTTGISKDGTILKASGNGTKITTESCEPAIRNTDYLDVVFGVAPNKPDVISFGCLITVDNALTKTTLGMNAAIHVLYSTDGSSYKEIDIYGSNGAGTVISSMTAPTAPSMAIAKSDEDTSTTTVSYTTSVETYEKGDAVLWIPLDYSGNAAEFLNVNEAGLKQLHLIIYICGPDGDCITSATGAGAQIKIEFLDINKSMYDAKANPST